MYHENNRKLMTKKQ